MSAQCGADYHPQDDDGWCQCTKDLDLPPFDTRPMRWWACVWTEIRWCMLVCRHIIATRRRDRWRDKHV